MDTTGGRAVILYGPPASGKSTVTGYLHQLDCRFLLFPRLKAGRGRTEEYRITDFDDIRRMQAAGEIIWANERYGAVYAVDRPQLLHMLGEKKIPVLQIGQRGAIEAILSALPGVQVTAVSLTCPRETAVQRITERVTGDAAERIAAYDATEQFADADLIIDTSTASPTEVANRIARIVLR